MLRRRGEPNRIEVHMVLPMKARPLAPDFHEVPRDVRDRIDEIKLRHDKTTATMKAHLLAESTIDISEE